MSSSDSILRSKAYPQLRSTLPLPAMTYGHPTSSLCLRSLHDDLYEELAAGSSDQFTLMTRVTMLGDEQTDVFGWSRTSMLSERHRWSEADAGRTFLIRCMHESGDKLSHVELVLDSVESDSRALFRIVDAYYVDTRTYHVNGTTVYSRFALSHRVRVCGDQKLDCYEVDKLRRSLGLMQLTGDVLDQRLELLMIVQAWALQSIDGEEKVGGRL